MIKINPRKLGTALGGSLVLFGLTLSCLSLQFMPDVHAVGLSSTAQVTVGATYYGGEYNSGSGSWVVDNANQCHRIASGEFSAASLGAIVSDSCDDDNGLGYQNSIPLHNTVSFAELSNNPSASDYAALGGLAAGTRVEIEYGGKCVVAEKRDVGQGGGPVSGHQRAIDLWWQTARSLNFRNGFDVVRVRLAGSASLTPLGQSTACKKVEKAPAVAKPKVEVPAAPTPVVAQPIAEVVKPKAALAAAERPVGFIGKQSAMWQGLVTLVVLFGASGLVTLIRFRR